jgi:hypothetical protein
MELSTWSLDKGQRMVAAPICHAARETPCCKRYHNQAGCKAFSTLTHLAVGTPTSAIASMVKLVKLGGTKNAVKLDVLSVE